MAVFAGYTKISRKTETRSWANYKRMWRLNNTFAVDVLHSTNFSTALLISIHSALLWHSGDVMMEQRAGLHSGQTSEICKS